MSRQLTQPPVASRQPAASQAVQPRHHSQAAAILRAIGDLKKAIDDFLNKIRPSIFSASENALYVPYDAGRARKDFDTLSTMLLNLEKIIEERDILHMRDRDYIGPGKPNGSTIEELLDRAVKQKNTVDAEFHKLTSAAAAAANAAAAASRWRA
ncbi:hypothetical protein FGB62_44g118 [Gracilaria domingensis]|nr:hypothetical protein FGB62_44g118 [Gracilaria domingensis]